MTNGLRQPLFDKDDETVHRPPATSSATPWSHGLYKSTVSSRRRARQHHPRGRDPTQTSYNRKRDEDYMFPPRSSPRARAGVDGGPSRREFTTGTTSPSTASRTSGTPTTSPATSSSTTASARRTCSPRTRTIQTRSGAPTGRSRRGSPGCPAPGDEQARLQPQASRVRATGGLRPLPVRRAQDCRSSTRRCPTPRLSSRRTETRWTSPFDELIANDVLSGERLEEIIAANPAERLPGEGPIPPVRCSSPRRTRRGGHARASGQGGEDEVRG